MPKQQLNANLVTRDIKGKRDGCFNYKKCMRHCPSFKQIEMLTLSPTPASCTIVLGLPELEMTKILETHRCNPSIPACTDINNAMQHVTEMETGLF